MIGPRTFDADTIHTAATAMVELGGSAPDAPVVRWLQRQADQPVPDQLAVNMSHAIICNISARLTPTRPWWRRWRRNHAHPR